MTKSLAHPPPRNWMVAPPQQIFATDNRLCSYTPQSLVYRNGDDPGRKVQWKTVILQPFHHPNHLKTDYFLTFHTVWPQVVMLPCKHSPLSTWNFGHESRGDFSNWTYWMKLNGKLQTLHKWQTVAFQTPANDAMLCLTQKPWLDCDRKTVEMAVDNAQIRISTLVVQKQHTNVVWTRP